MIKRSYFHILSLLVVSVFAVLALAQPASAEELSSGSTSTSWSQTVQLTTPKINAVVSVDMPSALSGTGTAVDPFITRNQNITLDIKMIGEGHMVLTDREGNVIATYDKLTAPEEIIQINTVLISIGDHNFTATYYDLNDPDHIYNLVQIFVRYESLNLPPFAPPLPQVPNTGGFPVLYIQGYAIPTLSLIFWLAVLIILAGGTFYLMKLRKNKK